MAINVNSTNSTSSTSSGYKSNALAGISSGLDTESLVESLTSNIQTKIDKNKQDTQVFQWQQEAYRAISTKVEDFYDKYFKYTSSNSSIMNEAFFDADYCNSSSSAVSVSGSTAAMDNVVIRGGSIQMATKSSLTSSHQLNVGNISGDVDTSKLADLAGTTMTFSYNGLSKTIAFDESDKDQYTGNAEDFSNYLNDKLADAFGNGKVTTSAGDDGKVSFAVADTSSTFMVKGASDGVLGTDGIFGVTAGTSNKINTSSMKLSSIDGLEADADGNYSFSVNGTSFSFTADQTLGNVIATVNNSKDANASMAYSSVTNTFSLVSKGTGSASEIKVSGNLANSLFGTDAERSNNVGQDFSASMSFDGGNTFSTVTRSSNSFTLDGANYDFANAGDGEDITFKAGTDVDAIATKVKTFIDDYNSILKSINDETTAKKYGEDVGSGKEYLPLTDAQKKEMSDKEIEEWTKKAKTGLLSHDSTLQDVASKLRSAMTSMVESNGSALFQYGIDSKAWTDRGVLAVDEDKLKAKIAEDPNTIKEMFTGKDGIASRVKNVLTYAIKGTDDGTSKGALIDIAGSSKSVTDTESTISKRIKSLQTALTALQTKLENKKDFWWKKFTSMESYIGSMNTQSAFLGSN